jgi:predicted Holliday junction resolvase-like endonuclease
MTVAHIIMIASLVALLVVASMHVRYKATHKWTDDDLARERKRSAASRAGLSVEHLVTLDEEFTFNGRDAQPLGSPVDFIVFDGLDEGELREIVFVEVKSGKRSQLNPANVRCGTR